MKAIMPMMIPMKQAKRERIMRARVASKWAVDKVKGQSLVGSVQVNRGE